MAEQLGEFINGSIEFEDAIDGRCILVEDGPRLKLHVPPNQRTAWSRKQVQAFVGHLQGWLDTGRLLPNEDVPPGDWDIAARLATEVVRRMKSEPFASLVQNAADARDWLHIPSAVKALRAVNQEVGAGGRRNIGPGLQIGDGRVWHNYPHCREGSFSIGFIRELLMALAGFGNRQREPRPHPMAGWGRWASEAEGFWFLWVDL